MHRCVLCVHVCGWLVGFANSMQYVSAFAVSHYACDVFRTGKPFNPLLGETYELEREDLGFRVLCEQVCNTILRLRGMSPSKNDFFL